LAELCEGQGKDGQVARKVMYPRFTGPASEDVASRPIERLMSNRYPYPVSRVQVQVTFPDAMQNDSGRQCSIYMLSNRPSILPVYAEAALAAFLDSATAF
jgi:hypothetical protein